MIRDGAFFVAGLLIGSFLTVVIHRVPRRESITRGRSMCPTCGIVIRARDNVPVFSWLLLRGRCRGCRSPISPAYPLTELATGVLFVAASVAFADLWVAVLMSFFFAVLVALSEIDLRERIIPNRIVYAVTPVAAVAILAIELGGGGLSLSRALIGTAVFGGGLLIIAIVSPRGMGMGDVKLAALIGLVVGSVALPRVAVAAGVAILLGGVAAVVALLMGRGRKSALPFGPFLAAGAAVAVLAGAQIAHAYLRLMT